MTEYAKHPFITLMALGIMWGLWSISVHFGYHGITGMGIVLAGFFLISFGYRIGTGKWL